MSHEIARSQMNTFLTPSSIAAELRPDLDPEQACEIYTGAAPLTALVLACLGVYSSQTCEVELPLLQGWRLVCSLLTWSPKSPPMPSMTTNSVLHLQLTQHSLFGACMLHHQNLCRTYDLALVQDQGPQEATPTAYCLSPHT